MKNDQTYINAYKNRATFNVVFFYFDIAKIHFFYVTAKKKCFLYISFLCMYISLHHNTKKVKK